MAAWTPDELEKIGGAEEVRIAPLRGDGTLRNPVTIWIVRVDDDLYVRSAYGRSAAWFRGGQMRREGRIQGGGIEKDVLFTDADHRLNDEIDAGYRAKYQRQGAQYVNMMVNPEARIATIKLTPR
ncbi:MAG: DUF2255 family protein [Candidatus Binataceae bacterium]